MFVIASWDTTDSYSVLTDFSLTLSDLTFSSSVDYTKTFTEGRSLPDFLRVVSVSFGAPTFSLLEQTDSLSLSVVSREKVGEQTRSIAAMATSNVLAYSVVLASSTRTEHSGGVVPLIGASISTISVGDSTFLRKNAFVSTQQFLVPLVTIVVFSGSTSSTTGFDTSS